MFIRFVKLLFATLTVSLSLVSAVLFVGSKRLNSTNLAFVRGGSIWLLDIGHALEHPLTNRQAEERYASPDWAPNARELVYIANPNFYSSVFVMSFSGENFQVLRDEEINGSSPSWSPNGDHVVVQYYREGISNLFTIDVMQRDVKQITNTDLLMSGTDWSPTSSQIAYSRKIDIGTSAVFVIDLPTGIYYQASQAFSGLTELEWSPDGQYIGFVANDTSLYVVEYVVGDDQINLPRGRSIVDAVQWTWDNDSQHVLYTSREGNGLYRINIETMELEQLLPNFDGRDIAVRPLVQ